MNDKNYPYNDVRRITSLRQLILENADQFGTQAAFRYRVNKDDIREVSYAGLKTSIDAYGTYLLAKGFREKKIAIMGENSYEWLLSFFSVVNSGNIVIPLDRELSSAEVRDMIDRSEVSLLIYAESLQGVVSELSDCASLSTICMKDLSAILAEGRSLIEGGDSSFVDYELDDDALAMIVYTSGTTGKSKGVMLSHRNLAMDTYGSCSNVFVGDNSILFLPLHHLYGMTACILVPFLYGRCVCINRSFREIADDLKAYHPEILFLVPLLIEALYKKICLPAAKLGENRFQFVKQAFGGKLQYIVSGGAAINPNHIEAFREYGIEVLNGYGITECAPVVAVNRNKYSKDGSVGLAIRECELRIDAPNENGEGEICVRGDLVSKGYFQMEKETADAFVDGWFHTGDLGYLDPDGFLFVTGRIKNLIILDNGENISPEELENKLLVYPIVEEVVVCEENKKMTAVVFPNTQYAAEQAITDVQQNLEQIVKEINKDLPHYKKIQGVRIRETEFKKTATKKIIRSEV